MKVFMDIREDHFQTCGPKVLLIKIQLPPIACRIVLSPTLVHKILLQRKQVLLLRTQILPILLTRL